MTTSADTTRPTLAPVIRATSLPPRETRRNWRKLWLPSDPSASLSMPARADSRLTAQVRVILTADTRLLLIIDLYKNLCSNSWLWHCTVLCLDSSWYGVTGEEANAPYLLLLLLIPFITTYCVPMPVRTQHEHLHMGSSFTRDSPVGRKRLVHTTFGTNGFKNTTLIVIHTLSRAQWANA